MTRLLLAGVGPRPDPDAPKVYAPGLRLQSVFECLRDAGHDVWMGEFPYAGTDTDGTHPEGAAGHRILPSSQDEAARALSELCSAEDFDGVVTVSDLAARAVALSACEGPLFIYYDGHPMAERQMLASVHDSDAGLADQWLYVLPALLRGDCFGTCSSAQRLALLGELGVAGRLNRLTCRSELVHVLRPPLPFREPFTPSSDAPFLRGKEVPPEARIILFTGGYNTWLDEETLFRAVDRVLEQEPAAVYVSTGGEIEGHVTRVFESFRSRVEGSSQRDRYCFLGWLAHRHYVDCCLEADVGVSADLPTLEGELGGRNRPYGWLWGGMRAVSTDQSEMIREFARHGLVEAVPVGDVGVFADRLLEAVRAGRLSEGTAERARGMLQEHFGSRKAFEPLLEWAESPRRAPDRLEGPRPANPLAQLNESLLEMAGRSGDRSGLRAKMEELVHRLSGSRAFSLFAKTHPEIDRLLTEIREQLGRETDH